MGKLGKRESGVGKTHLQVFRVLLMGRWGKPMCGNFVMPSKNEGSHLIHFAAKILAIGLEQPDGLRQHILLWGVQCYWKGCLVTGIVPVPYSLCAS